MSTQGLGRTLTGGNDLTTNPSDGGYREVHVLGLLRVAYRAAKELLDGLPATGWRWRRPPIEHPGWCARDHTCSVRPELLGPQSEHRSPISTWWARAGWGRITATRVLGLGRRKARLELRIQIELSDTSDRLAFAQSVQIPQVVEQAITTTLAELEVAARVRADLIRQRPELEQHRPALTARRWAS